MTQSVHNSGTGSLHSKCPPYVFCRRGSTYSSFLKIGLTVVLVLLLALCMAAPAAAVGGPCGSCKDIFWDLTDGTLTISGEGEMPEFPNTPWLSQSYCNSFSKVVINSGITSISDGAFKNCLGIHSVSIPESVTSIGNSAFYGCWPLTSITIPSGVTSIGKSAFEGCSRLTSITIPSGVTSISDQMFSGCSGLTSITIPSGVTSIGTGAFAGCRGLTSITIPSSFTSISDRMFSGCSGLTSITIPSGVTNIGDGAFFGCSGLTSITIPSGVTSIGSGAFSYCSGLTSITIPSGVTSISNDAFSNCGITSINIPSGVTSIGSNAFHGCFGLTNIIFDEGSKLKSIGDSAFQYCYNLTSITIPYGVTSIGHWAFYDSPHLSSVEIPNSVEEIDVWAFAACPNLTSITIPASVTNIGIGAFEDCSNLSSIHVDDNNQNYKSINGVLFSKNGALLHTYPMGKTDTSYVIPSGVTSINNWAFVACPNLTSVTIPFSVSNFGEHAFLGCFGLTSITIPSNSENINIEYRSFSALAQNSIIYCRETTAAHFDDNNYTPERTAIAVKNTADGSYTFINAIPNLVLNETNAPVGVTFDGWFEDKEYTKRVDSIDAGTITPLWLKNDNILKDTYTLTITPTTGGIASASASSAAAGTEITLTAIPAIGYVFKEWQVVSGGITISGNKFTMPANDVIVKAVFEVGTGNIIIDSAEKWNETTLNSAVGTVYVVGNWELQPLYQSPPEKSPWLLKGDVVLDFSDFRGTFTGISGNDFNSAVIGCVNLSEYTLTIKKLSVKDAVVNGDGITGGIISAAEANAARSSITFIDCDVENCSIYSSSTGVISCFVSIIGEVNFHAINCNIRDCTLRTADDYGADVAGFVAWANDVDSIVCDNCVIQNCTFSSMYKVAGFLGNSLHSNVTFNNCSIYDSSMTAFNGHCSAGFVGEMDRAIMTADDCKVVNCTMTARYQCVGGFVSNVRGASITTNNCEVLDSVLCAGYESVGGIVGSVTVGYEEERHSDVMVNHCDVKNSTMTASYRVGGLVGYIGYCSDVTLDGCQVVDCVVTADNHDNHLNEIVSSGGLIGYIYDADVNGGSEPNHLKNCNIISADYLGKTIGYVSNVNLIGKPPIYVSLDTITGPVKLVGNHVDSDVDGRIIVISSPTEEYTITISSTAGGSASASATSAAAGTEITLTATPDTGYVFKEWQVVSGGVTISGNKFIMPACDVEVKAVFEASYKPTEPPTNVKIVEGHSTVVAGDAVTYKAFATGADGFIWYLDNIEIGSGSSCTFTVPQTYEGKHVVKVSAWKGNKGNFASAEKTIHVSVSGGILGEFGESISQSVDYPAVGDITVFSIAAVSNATKYTWEFGTDKVTTTAPSVSYTLMNDILDIVVVTAYNSTESSKSKTYRFMKAGNKPHISEITASPASPVSAGTTVTYTAKIDFGNGPFTYKWMVDGATVSGETSGTYTKTWAESETKRHEVTVYVSNIYGNDGMSTSYTITPQKNKHAVIEKIIGSANLKEGENSAFSAVISSGDDYSLSWYVDNVLMKESGSDDSTFITKFSQTGKHTIKLIVTTAAGKVTEKEKNVKVISSSDWDKNTAKPDKDKPLPEEAVNPRLDDGGDETGSVLGTVVKISIGKGDVSEDAADVKLLVEPVIEENKLPEFTVDMGEKSDVLMKLSITPSGLKNEKDLDNAALLTFRISKTEVTGSKSVKFYRYDTGDTIEKWVELPIVSCDSDKNYWIFTIKTSGFSYFVGVSTSYTEEVPDLPPQKQSSSSSSSRDYGASIWLPATAEPTATPAVEQPTQAQPTASPQQPTQTSATPAPFLGILAGLGAAAVFFGLRRR